MAAGANETDLTLTYNTTGLPGLIWNYGIFIPTLSVFGILGNLLTLFVLWSKDKKFAGFIYYYIRGLAIVDLFQICFTLQICYFICQHLFITQHYILPTSYYVAFYIWNILNPTWTALTRASDFLMLLMAYNRLNVMKNLDKARLEAWKNPKKGKWIKFYIGLAITFSFVFHLPQFLQFHIVETHVCTDPDNDLGNKEAPQVCWNHFNAYQDSTLYILYGLVYMVAMKLIPSGLLVFMNIMIWQKLKTAWSHRRKLKLSISHLNREKPRRQFSSICGLLRSEKRTATTVENSSVSTVSRLLVVPQFQEVAPNQLVVLSQELKRSLAIKKKKKPASAARKMMIFSLPTKATTKELRVTLSLFVVVICHTCLTIPSTVMLLLWTAFPDFYANIDDQDRVIIVGIADALMSFNYAINFYLHFFSNQDIRQEAMAKLRIKACLKQ